MFSFLSPPDLLLKLCQKELSFLKNCLQVNPKSYSVWHHRQWIMEYMPQPDWNEELRLCNLFLSYDERNCMFIYYYFQTFWCKLLRQRSQARMQCFSDSNKENQISNISKKKTLEHYKFSCYSCLLTYFIFWTLSPMNFFQKISKIQAHLLLRVYWFEPPTPLEIPIYLYAFFLEFWPFRKDIKITGNQNFYASLL